MTCINKAINSTHIITGPDFGIQQVVVGHEHNIGILHLILGHEEGAHLELLANLHQVLNVQDRRFGELSARSALLQAQVERARLGLDLGLARCGLYQSKGYKVNSGMNY